MTLNVFVGAKLRRFPKIVFSKLTQPIHTARRRLSAATSRTVSALFHNILFSNWSHSINTISCPLLRLTAATHCSLGFPNPILTSYGWFRTLLLMSSQVSTSTAAVVLHWLPIQSHV